MLSQSVSLVKDRAAYRAIHTRNQLNSKPRLLMIIPDLGIGGGAERVVANLLGAMDPGLFDYHLATLTEYPEQHRVPEHVNWVTLNCPRVETSLLTVARHIAEVKPDVICSHIVAMNVCTAASAAAARSQPSLVMVDHHIATDVIVSDTSAKGKGPLHTFLVPAMRWAYGKADRIVGCSRAVLNETVRVAGVDPSKGVVIHNPIVFADLEQRSQEPTDIPWLNDPGLEVVVGVGRLIPFKNFELLIEAFALLSARRPQARLVILGDGYLRPVLQDQIEKHGLAEKAQLAGARQNPYAAMARARVVALTSFTEGLSTVLVEAMACGTPVVATNFASARDVVPDWGIPPVEFSPEAIAAALEAALVSERQSDRLKKFASSFAVGPVARKYEEVFLESCTKVRSNSHAHP